MKKIREDLFVDDRVDFSKKYCFYQVEPFLKLPGNEAFEERVTFGDREGQAYNSGQRRFLIKTTSLESQIEIYTFLYKRGWKRFIRRDSELAAFQTEFVLKEQSSINDLVNSERFINGEVVRNVCLNGNGRTLIATINLKDIVKFKTDLLDMPGYIGIWYLDTYGLREQEQNTCILK